MPVSVRALITDSQRVLMVTNQWVPGYFVLPGGSVEADESLRTALDREIIEELGVKPEIGNVVAIHQIKKHGKYSMPGIIFHVTNIDDFMDIDLEQTTHGQTEIDEVRFSDNFAKFLPAEIADILPELQAEEFSGSSKLIISDDIN